MEGILLEGRREGETSEWREETWFGGTSQGNGRRLDRWSRYTMVGDIEIRASCIEHLSVVLHGWRTGRRCRKWVCKENVIQNDDFKFIFQIAAGVGNYDLFKTGRIIMSACPEVLKHFCTPTGHYRLSLSSLTLVLPQNTCLKIEIVINKIIQNYSLFQRKSSLCFPFKPLYFWQDF